MSRDDMYYRNKIGPYGDDSGGEKDYTYTLGNPNTPTKKYGVIIDKGYSIEVKSFRSEREAKSFYDCLLSNFEEASLFEIKEGKQAKNE